MNNTADELLRSIVAMEAEGLAQSLFQIAHRAELHYGWSREAVRQLEALGLVTVRRNGPGLPLIIASTEHGRAVIAKRKSGKVAKWQEAPI